MLLLLSYKYTVCRLAVISLTTTATILICYVKDNWEGNGVFVILIALLSLYFPVSCGAVCFDDAVTTSAKWFFELLMDL